MKFSIILSILFCISFVSSVFAGSRNIRTIEQSFNGKSGNIKTIEESFGTSNIKTVQQSCNIQSIKTFNRPHVKTIEESCSANNIKTIQQSCGIQSIKTFNQSYGVKTIKESFGNIKGLVFLLPSGGIVTIKESCKLEDCESLKRCLKRIGAIEVPKAANNIRFAN